MEAPVKNKARIEWSEQSSLPVGSSEWPILCYLFCPGELLLFDISGASP
jgi:hypothetical protein